MNIHEYQLKRCCADSACRYQGEARLQREEAVAAAQELGGPVWVVKAQIHAGGRGKGGGVRW